MDLMLVAKSDSGQTEKLKKEIFADNICFTLDRAFFENARELTVASHSFDAKAGDTGFYLFPCSRSNSGAALTRFSAREDVEYRVKDATVSFFAVGCAEAVYVVWIDRTYRYEVRGSCKNGSYHIELFFDFTIQPTENDICLHVLTLPAGADHNDIARAIREYRLVRGEMRPLAEKVRERSALEYALLHPEIRIRMGWKPVPTPIVHQTPETEPPMRVACSFQRVRELADEFKRQGIEGAEFCLVGWNQKGHDGRWPQIFPVEEALGGEAELKKTIDYLQSLGYAITCHTNTIDHYEIADSFTFDQLAHDIQGRPIQEEAWAGGAAYRACPITQLSYAEKDLPRVAELGFAGLHYIDVLSILYPPICFHKEHPCGIVKGIELMRQIMRMCHKHFGGFSSEGNMDWAVGELDYSLYNSFRSYKKKAEGMQDQLIPMWELIYHGILLYNPTAETVNYSIKTADEAVTLALYGGKPSFYFYSKFKDDGGNWMGQTDMMCDDDEQMRESVAKVKQAVDEYRKLQHLQTVYMRSYEERKDGLRIVTYENGTRIAGNYTDLALELDGEPIAPHSYRVFA